MLRAVPRCLFPLTFEVMLDLEKVGEVELGWIREKGEFRIGGLTCEAKPSSARQPSFSFICDGLILAIAKQKHRFAREFEVDAHGHALQLRAVAFWKREFAVFESGTQIGRISPEKSMSHRAIIDLPDEIPIQLQLFLFWLVEVLWQRGGWWGGCLELLARF